MTIEASEAKVFHSDDASWREWVANRGLHDEDSAAMAKALASAPVKALPTYDLESGLMDEFHGPIVGIDEAGRGPWAGPVVVAAVILNPDRIPEGLNDSKVLTAEAREDRYAEIMATSCVSIAIGNVCRIDRFNILQATLWGMRAAHRGLEAPAAAALIDGNIAPRRFPCKTRTVVGGDGRSLSIAAASIVAKVTRDRMMVKLARRYRRYGWESNKGYGTAEHARAIQKHGVCTHHRRSFSPIELALKLLKEPTAEAAPD
jgi:ribonuclease HII